MNNYNEKKGMRDALPETLLDVSEANFDYIESLIQMLIDLCCYETPFESKTVVPEYYYPIIREAERRFDELQNLYFYGELKRPDSGENKP